MDGAAVLDLVVRTAVALAAVLAVLAAAYAIAKRRTGGPTRRAARRGSTAPAIEVVGRVGLARSATAVALRFGDRVVMVGVSENAPTAVLADIDVQRWDELHPVEETRVPTAVPFGRRSPADPAPPRPSFFDALRDATTRRA